MYYNENAFHEIKQVNKTQCKKIKHFKDLRKTRICVHKNTNSQCCKYDTPLATFLSIASSLYSSNKHTVSKYSHRYVVSVSCHQSPQQGTACTPSRAVPHTSTAKKKEFMIRQIFMQGVENHTFVIQSLHKTDMNCSLTRNNCMR